MRGAVQLGWEREARGKASGFRTTMLIALGTAAFTVLSLEMARMGTTADRPFDSLRAMQGVVGGIGFLGAGAVIRAGGSIRGTTTAASIWVVGAIGIACGIGSYQVAAVCVVFCFLVLTVLDVVERRLIHNEPDAADQRQREPKSATDKQNQ